MNGAKIRLCPNDILPNQPDKICAIDVSPWSLPLIAPFRVATRLSTEAVNVLVRVTGGDGSYGIGAAAPVEYITGESQESVIASIMEVSSYLIDQPYDHLLQLSLKLEELLPGEPSARAALEMAIYDIWAKRKDISLWQHFGGCERSLTTDITIPIVPADHARDLTLEALSQGFSLFKIKIGDNQGTEADLARIAAVSEAAPESFLRIDANQAFEPDAAVDFVQSAELISQKIQLVEQPVVKEDFSGLKYVKEHIHLPVFADESARSLSDAARLVELGAVDGINVKLMKSGIHEAVEIARLCKRNRISLMIGCMLESPLGIAAAAAIASGLGGFDFIDLDSHKLLKPVKSLSGNFNAVGASITMGDKLPGWGILMLDRDGGTILDANSS